MGSLFEDLSVQLAAEIKQLELELEKKRALMANLPKLDERVNQLIKEVGEIVEEISTCNPGSLAQFKQLLLEPFETKKSTSKGQPVEIPGVVSLTDLIHFLPDSGTGIILIKKRQVEERQKLAEAWVNLLTNKYEIDYRIVSGSDCLLQPLVTRSSLEIQLVGPDVSLLMLTGLKGLDFTQFPEEVVLPDLPPFKVGDLVTTSEAGAKYRVQTVEFDQLEVVCEEHPIEKLVDGVFYFKPSDLT
jgi:hypothetical protein